MKIDVYFNYNEESLFENAENTAKEVVSATLIEAEFEEDCYLDVNIVDDDEIRTLNREYRGKDSVTDVLSFVQYDESFEFTAYEDDEIFLGDIVISAPRLRAQALEYGHSVEREYAYLVCHSVLHLLGYDHIEESDKIEMRTMEETILKKLNYTR